ncbi:ParB/RepB/Spo0J family partition protein [Tuwongella immobilis]|uniref:ParB-like N-terminal domain-containing protein n=1 Tax=Tuwongella immobilis TaxID=692036 RepID=A0A6C2YVZ9_9BACT|nr:ParB/RepB/Spo0J family partition protein [Tuwongella immobilis]VIP05343.1 chromosome partitioning protein : ParB-like partition protein OS=Singulisphaera acidiphila (strain ATCC BAA-1392 / DSM 18658 / VKM B-2454 / MOB10) GN=Sinac_7574 PE=4 SV=1: ParBc [Tuwongella immobilis]VTS08042.1 chromosome partitioning protein : ParB-like partition protein OS=Singulisphaera acidiphila (strain ATCC BAA-1392 / DSM 18658 / VKM B-2454 / MOB10) GN=Sinac_7574 PE=4 SV=1: ParBc [Tuwongella immobilis]
MNTQLLAIDDIVPSPHNPPGRLTPEDPELQSLCESIRSYGVREPPTVYRDVKTGRYVLLSGHRRWYCAKECGHAELLCLVTEPPNGAGEEQLRQATVNIHRRDYTPIQFAKLIEGLMTECSLTGKEVAAKLNVSPALVSTHLSLLRLNEEHQQQIEAGNISLSVGQLMSQTENPSLRVQLAEMASRGASRKQVADAIKGERSKPKGKRIAIRSGAISVAVDHQSSLAALIRELGSILRDARRAAANGKNLDEFTQDLTANPEGEAP